MKNIQAKGAFTVSVGDEAHMAECDYVGVASGNNVPNKLEKCGFQYEGTLKLAAKLYDGSIYDNDCFAITREQWVDWVIENR